MPRDEIIAFVEERRRRDPDIPYPNLISLDYMLNPDYFNRRPARDYLAACWSIEDVEILRNEIDLEDETGTHDSVVEELESKGFSRLELFGLTHILVARKIAGS